MAEGSDLPALVRASADGDEKAWNELVRRYAYLVVAVTRQYRLSPVDAQDVSQTVWLRLVEHLAEIREPRALASWIVTTAKHECLRQLRTGNRTVPVDPLAGGELDRSDPADVDGALLAAAPPQPYVEISRRLGIPVGSIGPTRRRVLEKLRATTAIRTYLAATWEAAPTGGGRHALAELE